MAEQPPQTWFDEHGEDTRPPMTGASVTQSQDFHYTIVTDLDIAYVSEIALEVFQEWVAFANGDSSLDGHRISHPTGRYAESISLKQNGSASVAIVADPKVDIVAYLMETGHGFVDLKTKKGFQQGRVFHSAMWAYPSKKYGAFGGPEYATVGSTGWIVPPMRAYSPAKAFAQLAARLARGA